MEVLRSTFVADISSLSSLQDWSHLVVQSSGPVTSSSLQLYLDGNKLTTLTDIAGLPYPFTWEIGVDGNVPVMPQQDIAILKHLRIYNRLATDAEVLADYKNACLSPVGALAQLSGAGGPLDVWGRFNIPAPGSATTTGPGSTVEYVKQFIVPDHQLPTVYAYNSLNQVVKQQSPDGGISQFWYDRLGRLIISQNEEQKSPVIVNTENPANRYSYTAYDALGRITEVGEKIGASTVDESVVRQVPVLNAWMTNSGSKRQVTLTAYDEAPLWAPSSLAGTQLYLRKRVAATALLSASPNAVNGAVNRLSASYYSYDIAGNVSELTQENTALKNAEATRIAGATGLKKMRYEYDLVSGKVNKVLYQDDKWDQFYYRYDYDAENRIIRAESSRYNEMSSVETWETDARYRYYLHGPLARTELGKDFVQGMDYAYTLQGWLKGVNSQELNMAKDLNGDGATGTSFSSMARDVFGFSLGYYAGDYQPIGSSVTAFGLSYTGATTGAVSGKPLYNGNISNATYALSRLSNGAISAYTYRYDQLNRLTGMDRYAPTVSSWNASHKLNDHSEEMSYDANGNINTYKRSGDRSVKWDMDQLKYLYYYYDLTGQLRQYDKTMALPGDVGRLTNRLAQVDDAVAGNVYTEDIDDQAEGNYQYDKIGNLVKDEAEGLQSINWTVYGKIASISKLKAGVTTTISYGYDASGNRISKQVQVGSAAAVSTYYLRDAQGNVMGTYRQEGSDYRWEEQHLYGSSRLGIMKPQLMLGTGGLLADDNFSTFYSGTNGHIAGNWGREYELTNHLGNVVGTVSDAKLGVPDGSGGISYYIAEVLSQNEYYPFGMGMVGRKFSAGDGYRYGFNGKENDNEVKGEGNQQDYGLRIYDPRLGKFLSSDPLVKDFPWYTPYQYAGNTPIQAVDLDGGEPKGYNFSNPYVASHSGSGVKFIPSSYDGKVYEHARFGLVTAYAVQDIDKRCYLIFESATGAKKQQWYLEYDKSGWKGNANSFQWEAPPDPSNVLTAMTVGPLVALPTLITGGFAIGSMNLTEISVKGQMMYWRYAPAAGVAGRTLAEFLDESGGVGMQNAAIYKAAFGIEQQARALAEKINGVHLMDFKGNWKMEFLEIINDPKMEIHFSLNDLEGSLFSNINSPWRSSTNWELSELYHNKEAFERTIFHVGDKQYVGNEIFDVELP